jgi:carbon-monoxide dehydrogenase medium subunit
MLLQQGRCKRVRIALGSVAPIPLLAQKASTMLEGKAPDIELIEAVARTAAEESRPIDDHRASAWYRKQVVSAMVAQILNNIAKEEADARP